MKKSLYMTAFTAALLSSLSMNVARADGDDDSLTKYGVTFYGVIDANLTYQSHGAGSSPTFPDSLNYILGKSANNGQLSVGSNAMQQSMLGIKGDINVAEGTNAIFKLESGFIPTSGSLEDGAASLSANAGLANYNQSSNGDSSLLGQLFNRQAYAGLRSDTWGQLTWGRQYTLLADTLGTYDPQVGSMAFSYFGYSGSAAGSGDTGAARQDSALKYTKNFGVARLSAFYKIGDYQGQNANLYAIDLGTDVGNFSIDLGFNHTNNAISLSATAVNTFKATMSDNTAWDIALKYNGGNWRVMAGDENIVFQNPNNPVTATPFAYQGNYVISSVSTTAYTSGSKILNIAWMGGQYDLSPSLQFRAAWYHLSQNDYGGGGTDSSQASNSGTENIFSVAVDDAISKHFDIYAGFAYSYVNGGLANGYSDGISNWTSTIDPTIGARLKF